MEESHVANLCLHFDFGKVNFIDPTHRHLILRLLIYNGIGDIRPKDIIVKVDSKEAWIICRVNFSCFII